MIAGNTEQAAPWNMRDVNIPRPRPQPHFCKLETSTPCISICYCFDGLVQDCSNSSALAMELLQSCTKPSIWRLLQSFLVVGKDLVDKI